MQRIGPTRSRSRAMQTQAPRAEAAAVGSRSTLRLNVAKRSEWLSVARVLAAFLLHTCMCTWSRQVASGAALSAIEEALPQVVLEGHGDPDARRQAELAVNWSLFNQQRKENGDLESASGPGSSSSFTHVTRDYLQDVIERYSVRSIVDVACGDWNWMGQIDLAALGVESYVGYWPITPSPRDARRQPLSCFRPCCMTLPSATAFVSDTRCT